MLEPVTGFTIRRTGSASIQIMVDAVPEELKHEKNCWSIDVGNKKPNALYQGFPKLKAECIKIQLFPLANRLAVISTGKLPTNRNTNQSIKDQI
ncbi:hypothetical protein [Dyadobacter psychrophilus]|uniref:hypothetical protein n=1 Tax=Dyadobacter psychrophilus TaxID=651661 RepID=UPI0011317242|nr:hypothetical protein [Dyadobacter psychrophilus]